MDRDAGDDPSNKRMKRQRNDLFDHTFISNRAGALSLTNRIPFPTKLFQMLEDAEQSGHSSIVSWSADGLSFRVHDSRLFVSHVMPQYFRQSRYKSFQRQLHLYGFTRISQGNEKGSCFHHSFVRSDREKCKAMEPMKRKKRRQDQSLSHSNGEEGEEDETDGTDDEEEKMGSTTRRGMRGQQQEDNPTTTPATTSFLQQAGGIRQDGPVLFYPPEAEFSGRSGPSYITNWGENVNATTTSSTRRITARRTSPSGRIGTTAHDQRLPPSSGGGEEGKKAPAPSATSSDGDEKAIHQSFLKRATSLRQRSPSSAVLQYPPNQTDFISSSSRSNLALQGASEYYPPRRPIGRDALPNTGRGREFPRAARSGGPITAGVGNHPAAGAISSTVSSSPSGGPRRLSEAVEGTGGALLVSSSFLSQNSATPESSSSSSVAPKRGHQPQEGQETTQPVSRPIYQQHQQQIAGLFSPFLMSSLGGLDYYGGVQQRAQAPPYQWNPPQQHQHLLPSHYFAGSSGTAFALLQQQQQRWPGQISSSSLLDLPHQQFMLQWNPTMTGTVPGSNTFWTATHGPSSSLPLNSFIPSMEPSAAGASSVAHPPHAPGFGTIDNAIVHQEQARPARGDEDAAESQEGDRYQHAHQLRQHLLAQRPSLFSLSSISARSTRVEADKSDQASSLVTRSERGDAGDSGEDAVAFFREISPPPGAATMASATARSSSGEREQLLDVASRYHPYRQQQQEGGQDDDHDSTGAAQAIAESFSPFLSPAAPPTGDYQVWPATAGIHHEEILSLPLPPPQPLPPPAPPPSTLPERSPLERTQDYYDNDSRTGSSVGRFSSTDVDVGGGTVAGPVARNNFGYHQDGDALAAAGTEEVAVAQHQRAAGVEPAAAAAARPRNDDHSVCIRQRRGKRN